MGINYNILRAEIAKQSEKAILSKAKPLIKKEFDRAKTEMLNYFDEHDVTKEIKAGPDASSQFVDAATDSHGGNLYSLIGFSEGESPTEELRDILDQSIKLNISQVKRNVKQNSIEFTVPVVIPTIGEINEKVGKRVNLAWTGRPFTDLIEKGVTGFNKYLFRKDGFKSGVSESGTAIETKKPIRGGSLGKIKYVSDILKKFRDSILGK